MERKGMRHKGIERRGRGCVIGCLLTLGLIFGVPTVIYAVTSLSGESSAGIAFQKKPDGVDITYGPDCNPAFLIRDTTRVGIYFKGKFPGPHIWTRPEACH